MHDDTLPLCFLIEADKIFQYFSGFIHNYVVWCVGLTAVLSVLSQLKHIFLCLLQEFLCLHIDSARMLIWDCRHIVLLRWTLLSCFSCLFPSFGTVDRGIFSDNTTKRRFLQTFFLMIIFRLMCIYKKLNNFLVLLVPSVWGGRERGWGNGAPSLLLLISLSWGQTSLIKTPELCFHRWDGACLSRYDADKPTGKLKPCVQNLQTLQTLERDHAVYLFSNTEKL